jgi:hypothetical protein
VSRGVHCSSAWRGIIAFGARCASRSLAQAESTGECMWIGECERAAGGRALHYAVSGVIKARLHFNLYTLLLSELAWIWMAALGAYWNIIFLLCMHGSLTKHYSRSRRSTLPLINRIPSAHTPRPGTERAFRDEYFIMLQYKILFSAWSKQFLLK